MAEHERDTLQSRPQPIFNAPISVVAGVGVLVAIHLLRGMMADATETRFVLSLAFIPIRYQEAGLSLPGGALARWWSPLTHTLLHGDYVHLLLNSAWLLIFGTILVRRIGAVRGLALGAASALAGVLCFYAFNPTLAAPVIGASGAVSGLMGAALRLLFSGMDQGGPVLVRDHPELIDPAPLGEALRDRRLLVTMGMLVILNLAMAYGIGGLNEPGALAWEAHLGGFALGLLAFSMFDKGRARFRGVGPAH